jgi:hypothetical protein
MIGTRTLCAAAALLCLCWSSRGAADEGGAAPSTKTYTDEDLARIARERRGAVSTLGSAETTAAAPQARSIPGAKGEAYWRGEAERLQRRLGPLRARADELRLRLAQAERRPPAKTQAARTRAAEAVDLLRLRLRRLEDEISGRQEDLEERARRAGALPGWLR